VQDFLFPPGIQQGQTAPALPPAQPDGEPDASVQQVDKGLVRGINSRALSFDFHPAVSFSLPLKTNPATESGFSGRLGEIDLEPSLDQLCSCARAPRLGRFPKGEAVRKGEAVSVCVRVVHGQIAKK
jgi:hypothetical protein